MKIIQDENELKKLVSLMEKNGMETIRGYGTFDEFKKDILNKNRVLYIGYLKDKNNKKNETHFIIEELEKDEDDNYQPTGIFTHYWDYSDKADEYVENLLKTNNIKSQDSDKRHNIKNFTQDGYYVDKLNVGDIVKIDKNLFQGDSEDGIGYISEIEPEYQGQIYLNVINQNDDEDFSGQIHANEIIEVIQFVPSGDEEEQETYDITSRLKASKIDKYQASDKRRANCDKSNIRCTKAECLKRAEFWLNKAECLKRAEFWLNKAENLKCNVITEDDIKVNLGNRAIDMGYEGYIDDEDIMIKDNYIHFQLDNADHIFDLEGDKWVSQKLYDAYSDIYYNEETGEFDEKSYKEDKELDDALEDELNKIYKDKIKQNQKTIKNNSYKTGTCRKEIADLWWKYNNEKKK